jgi:hypothetical protein
MQCAQLNVYENSVWQARVFEYHLLKHPHYTCLLRHFGSSLWLSFLSSSPKPILSFSAVDNQY